MEGARFWSYFWGKNMPIYMAECSLLVLVGPLDTGAKAIGTAWTIAPSQEEESIWGGKTLTKGIAL